MWPEGARTPTGLLFPTAAGASGEIYIISHYESGCNMDHEKQWQDMFNVMVEFAKKTDEINKRLVTALVIAIISFCVLSAIISTVYFTADYEIYPEMNQQQQMMSESGEMQQQQ
jgi:hypothetical protein